MDTVLELLQARRIPITPERRSLIERLASVSDHFDAEELYVTLRVEGLPVSRATLYRTLDLLVDVGYLRRFTLERGKARYEKLEGNEPLHGHLYCTACGAVVDFPVPTLEAWRRKAWEDYGFKAGLPELKMAGLCQGCQR